MQPKYIFHQKLKHENQLFSFLFNKNGVAMLKNLFFVFLPFLFLLVSCGADKVVMKPNYYNSIYNASAINSKNAKIVKVIDKRLENHDKTYKESENKTYKATEMRDYKGSPGSEERGSMLSTLNEHSAGFAQTGAFNKKVPYEISEPVITFVEKSVNRILRTRNEENIVPITIVLDKFYVYERTGLASEKGMFKCAMNFQYMASKDSIGSIYSYSEQTFNSGSDVTSQLEGLVYIGIYDCTRQFYEKFRTAIKDTANKLRIPDDILVEKQIPDEEKVIKKVKSKKLSSSTFGGSYLQGNMILTGIQLYYGSYAFKKKQQLVHGVAYQLNYFDVKNTKDRLEGSFFGFGGKYVPRFYFSKKREWFYLGGGLSLEFGSESDPAGNASFFFGPTFEESFGIKAGPLNLEIGLFQLYHFGSELLPNDTGYFLRLGFQV